MYKFWIWLRDFGNKKAKEAYMETYHHDRKCPNCKLWTSELGGAKSIVDDGDYHELMECIQCGYKSRWNLTSMVPFLDEPNN